MRLCGLVFQALRLNLIRSARAAPVGPSLVVLTLLVAAAPAAARSYTVLYPFQIANQHPGALIQASDGNFYGTTLYGGTSDRGTVFKITPAGVLTTLHNFAYSDGRRPYASLVQGTDGTFYGTALFGGLYDGGGVFV
jgi:uncharacterized repeat protein (TIGR03803 family)